MVMKNVLLKFSLNIPKNNIKYIHHTYVYTIFHVFYIKIKQISVAV